jgi:hypothetical protein
MPNEPVEPTQNDLVLEFRKVDDEFELDLDLPARTIKADSGNTLTGTPDSRSRSRAVVVSSQLEFASARLKSHVRLKSPTGNGG